MVRRGEPNTDGWRDLAEPRSGLSHCLDRPRRRPLSLPAMTLPASVPLVSYHTHTDLSHCGRPDMVFEAAVECAVTEGYAAVGFTVSD